MRIVILVALMIGCWTSLAVAQEQPASAPSTGPSTRPRTRFPKPEVRYDYGPDSQKHERVPQGKITEFVWSDCKTYPGTLRKCAVYVPAQYDASKPAALMVFQDGVRHYLYDEQDFKTATVLDNLIY